MSSKNPLSYRPDIDGLRAIAVVAVIMFHISPHRHPNGFLGVDVFFIISGFLITSISIHQLDSGKFSLLNFYERRIRRIFPALLLMMLTVLIVGWFFFLADEFKTLGKHLAAGAAYVSNFVLSSESGYFDTSSEAKPLLHLWSLAIEEQFYIFYPLLMIATYRRKALFLGTIALSIVASFIYCVWNVSESPSLIFYSPLARCWELLLGGALGYYLIRNPIRLTKVTGNLSSSIGLFFIILGFFPPKGMSFPGYWTLFPTLGTMLLILAGGEAWLNKKILASKPFVAVGLISYPLYLWHWLPISFVKIFHIEKTQLIKFLTIAGPILASVLTYFYVEKPLKKLSKVKSVPIILFLTLVMMGATGGYVYLNDGLEGTGPRTAEKSHFARYFENSTPDWNYFKREEIFKKYNEHCNFYDLERYRLGKETSVPLAEISPECYSVNSVSKYRVFLWGDSHASHLAFGIKKNLPIEWQLLQVSSSGCPPEIVSAESKGREYCLKSNRFAFETIRQVKPEVVVLAQARNHSFTKLEALATQLKLAGVGKVILMGPVPQWESDLPRIILRELWDSKTNRTNLSRWNDPFKINEVLVQESQKSQSLEYVNTIKLFCDDEGCLTYLGPDKIQDLTFYDDEHLTPVASDYLAKELLVPAITTNESLSQSRNK